VKSLGQVESSHFFRFDANAFKADVVFRRIVMVTGYDAARVRAALARRAAAR
jgi:hypothetical protein